MKTLNRLLENKARDIDSGYLSDSDFSKLEKYVSSFADRVKTYKLLQENADAIADQTSKQMAEEYAAAGLTKKPTDRGKTEGIQQSQADRCKFDFPNGFIPCMALCILRDDEQYFKEQVDWLQTILMAHQAIGSCLKAHRIMMKIIEQMFPPESVKLIRPYLDIAVMMLDKQ